LKILFIIGSINSVIILRISRSNAMTPLLSHTIWYFAMACAMWISHDENKNRGQNGFRRPPSTALLGMMASAYAIFCFYTLPMLLNKPGVLPKVLLGMMSMLITIFTFVPSWMWFIVFSNMLHVANLI